MSATFAALVFSALPSIPNPRPEYRDISARFVLDTTITTKIARVGDPVPLFVAAGFVIDGITIAARSRARGVVIDAVRPGRIRGRGSLAIQIVSVTGPDGTPLRVSGTYFVEPRPRRMTAPDPQVRILAGMAAGYGTAALASKVSNSADTIANTGLLAGVSAGILVGVLERGEDLMITRGRIIEVILTPAARPH